MSFSADISKFVKRCNDNADQATRLITLDLFRRVTQKSPVDTGHFRSSWVAQAGALPSGTTGNNVLAVAMTAKAGDVMWLANNLPYSVRLEYGHSKQAPSGMTRISIAETVAWANNLRIK